MVARRVRLHQARLRNDSVVICVKAHLEVVAVVGLLHDLVARDRDALSTKTVRGRLLDM